ncbi:MAG TPA: hypothetical protein VG122_18110 [Gemmata sp.]|jgi:hypothetical protein|nr:hypothetical protein [Gemmata sp.]
MRIAFAVVLLSGFAVLAQEPPQFISKDPEPRFGIPAKLKAYPQTTAKKALESAVEACEKSDYAYLIAHLLDPAFVERRITDRSKQFEASVELELARLRDYQYANPDRFPTDRLPLDKPGFLAAIVAKSRERAFKQLVRDVEQKMRDDPQSLRDMKKILRDGTFTDEGAGIKAVHPTVMDGALFFKKIGDRWFLENRQAEEPKKEP